MMKKIALAIWENRISPVFDVSETIRIFEIENRKILNRINLVFSSADPYGKARMLAGSGVDILICGAVSRPFSAALCDSGIGIIPFVTGKVDEVMAAYINGRLNGAAFAMPGCRGRRNRRRGGRTRKC